MEVVSECGASIAKLKKGAYFGGECKPKVLVQSHPCNLFIVMRI